MGKKKGRRADVDWDEIENDMAKLDVADGDAAAAGDSGGGTEKAGPAAAAESQPEALNGDAQGDGDEGGQGGDSGDDEGTANSNKPLTKAEKNKLKKLKKKQKEKAKKAGKSGGGSSTGGGNNNTSSSTADGDEDVAEGDDVAAGGDGDGDGDVSKDKGAPAEGNEDNKDGAGLEDEGNSQGVSELDQLQARVAAGETLSEAEKKKLKKLKKKQKEKEKKGGGKNDDKKPTGRKAQMLAIIKERERAEAEARRAAEEEEARLKREEEERIRKEQEEKEAAEARREAKKEKERLKKEALRAAGKAVTKKEKEEERRRAAARELLLKSGMKVAGLEDGGADAAKSKPKFEKKKNKQSKFARQQEEERRMQEAAEKARIEEEERIAREKAAAEARARAEAEANAAADDDDDDESSGDDWDASSGDEGLSKIKLANSNEDDVSSSDDEEDEDENSGEAVSSKPAARAAKTTHTAGADDSSDEGSSSEDESSSEDDDDKLTATEEAEERKRIAREAREARQQQALDEATQDNLRSPICCILGHVDTGKTKLLDKIRRTNVQDGEAGGITQQIGATYFPMEKIKEQTVKVADLRKGIAKSEVTVPGLLIIDTPGHESFTNLRTRGSGLCDLAILVVDIMHGLEPQTLESIGLLKARKTPFIVALNKVDRLYGWRACPMTPTREALREQDKEVVREFNNRVSETIVAFAEENLNAQLYYKNTDVRKTVSLVPTSAISGEGIPDMLMLLTELAQQFMAEKLMYLSSLQCTVLEVKVIEGLGTTIDVIIANGSLNEGDTIVLNGINGAIVTTIRALLTPEPMKELRVKSQYVHNKTLHAAIGCKISAQGLEQAVAGSEVLRVEEGDDVEQLKEEVQGDFNDIAEKYLQKGCNGVYVQASTLGSLEALLEFLKSSNIPVSNINIGPVHKKDVVKASVMLEHDAKYAVILAFDVEVNREARDLAEKEGIRIFTAEIIYHLFDQFTAYIDDLKAQKKAKAAAEVVFPCHLRIIDEQHVFNKKDPYILGMRVEEGIVRVGTPLKVLKPGHKKGTKVIELGTIASMEKDKKPVERATKGMELAVRIQGKLSGQQWSYGRHWDENDDFVSAMTRTSIDLLKENFRDDLSKDDWKLVVRQKNWLDIQ